MIKKITIFIFLIFSNYSFPQKGFVYESHKKSIKIPFKLYNNLVVIPLTFNNVPLNFLLDTGVENTILFSLEETDSLDLKNVKKIKIQGLGNGDPIEALHSQGNEIQIKEFKDYSHEIYVVLDQNISFSQQLGVPIHGIMGYEFFKNHIVEINYKGGYVSIYNPNRISSRALKNYQKIPIELELYKPYVFASVNINGVLSKVKLLIDSGGSDAIWLFENSKIKCSENYFNDLLGKGFSGDIYGKRSRIEGFTIANYDLKSPTISFPNEESLKHVTMVTGRNGSIGAGMLKRFDVIFDYKNLNFYLKKNSSFDEPFNYNMSGIEIIHTGVQFVEEKIELNNKSALNKIEINLNNEENKSFKYHFVLKPKYEISNIRPDSPAFGAGFKKGDVLLKINNIVAYKYSLQDINNLFQEEEGKVIKLEIERNGQIIKSTITLKKIL